MPPMPSQGGYPAPQQPQPQTTRVNDRDMTEEEMIAEAIARSLSES